MKLRGLLGFVAITLFLTGCGEIKPMAPEVSADFRNSPVAIAVVAHDHKLHYNEDVYKVLWIENRANSASFEGLWDIEKDLAEGYKSQFGNFGIQSSSFHEHLGQSDFDKLKKQVALVNLLENPDAKLTIDESIREKLAAKGLGYLLVFKQGPLFLKAESWFDSLIMNWSSLIFVVDVKTGDTSHRTHDGMYYYYKYENSPREIELDNLAGLKQIVQTAMDAQFGPNRIPKKLGL
ncbi:MAG: hypothetical protein JXR18_04665 [Neptuniibacter sp.]